MVEDFLIGLSKQNVMRVIFLEYLEQERGRGLQMPGLFLLAGHTLEHESTDHRDVPELALRHLRGIDTPLDVFGEMIRRKQFIGVAVVQWNGLIAQQLETVIIHRKREGDRMQATDPPGQDGRHGLVHQPAFEGVYEHVKTIPGLHMLDEQFVATGDMRKFPLQLHQWLQGIQLRLIRVPPARLLKFDAQHPAEMR